MSEKCCFALACFWRPDGQFGVRDGVTRTRVGYCGGAGPRPNYPSVYDHTEAVEVEYDPSLTTYSELLQLFWQLHDPCSCRKKQYMSAIFYCSDEQRDAAERSKGQHESDTGKGVATKILPLGVFYEAENYHQKYYLRTYHRAFYESLMPKEDPVTSTRDARLNGFLSGNGTLQDLKRNERLLNLNAEQMQYLERHISGEQKPPAVEPFVRTVAQVTWNYLKKTVGL